MNLTRTHTPVLGLSLEWGHLLPSPPCCWWCQPQAAASNDTRCSVELCPRRYVLLLFSACRQNLLHIMFAALAIPASSGFIEQK